MGIGIDAAALTAAINTMDATELASLRAETMKIQAVLYTRQQVLRAQELEQKRLALAAERLPAASMIWMPGDKVRVDHRSYVTLRNKWGIIDHLAVGVGGDIKVYVLVEGKKRKSPKYMCEDGFVVFTLTSDYKSAYLEVMDAT